MEQSLSWEADSYCIYSQQISSTSWNPKVYCVDWSSPLIFVLSQISPVHTVTSYFFQILILTTFQCYRIVFHTGHSFNVKSDILCTCVSSLVAQALEAVSIYWILAHVVIGKMVCVSNPALNLGILLRWWR